MPLPILTIPSPILRRKSVAVKAVDKKILKFIANLEETLVQKKRPKGVGLSAPQVGKLWRIFLTYLPKGKNPAIQVFINPQIIAVAKKLTLGPNPKKPILEGCLSIPGIYGPVWRHQWLKLQWLEPSGQTLVAKFSAFPARVIQHELDPLDGILFTDRAVTDKLPLYQEKADQLVPISLA